MFLHPPLTTSPSSESAAPQSTDIGRHSEEGSLVPQAVVSRCSKQCDQLFSSRLSSLKKRQSVPCPMILLGVDLIMPASCSRSE